MPRSKLSFMTTIWTKLRSRAAPAPIAPPIESMSSFICSGRSRRRPLIEQRRHHVREAELAFGIRGAAGADQHAHADRRLFMVKDGDHLQSVRQRLDLVRRKLDLARRQRSRRPLGRPFLELGLRACDAGAHEQNDECAKAQVPDSRRRRQCPHACLPAFRAFGSVRHRPALPDGITVSTSRFSGRKYVRATRWTSAVVMLWKMSNSASAVLTSL